MPSNFFILIDFLFFILLFTAVAFLSSLLFFLHEGLIIFLISKVKLITILSFFLFLFHNYNIIFIIFISSFSCIITISICVSISSFRSFIIGKFGCESWRRIIIIFFILVNHNMSTIIAIVSVSILSMKIIHFSFHIKFLPAFIIVFLFLIIVTCSVIIIMLLSCFSTFNICCFWL